MKMYLGCMAATNEKWGMMICASITHAEDIDEATGILLAESRSRWPERLGWYNHAVGDVSEVPEQTRRYLDTLAEQ